MSFKKDIIGLLVKWLNTLPSQGNIHGFEFHTGHHIFDNELEINFSSFYIIIVIIKDKNPDINIWNILPTK